MNNAVGPQEAAARLETAGRILIVTHEKPDGDAVGSSLGLQEFLRSRDKKADALLPSPLPRRFEEFDPGHLTTISRETVIADYDLIVVLDCANPERIAGGDQLDAAFLRSVPLLNIDHHSGNAIDASANWVDSTAAAASLMAAEAALLITPQLPKSAATLWLLGLMTDTGSFRFSNTNGRALRLAATLLDSGAELDRVINAVYFSKPRNQQQLEADLIQNHLTSALDGRYLYASLPTDLLKKHQFDMRDGEGLIDLLREREGAIIVALFYRKNGAVKVSLRSKDQRFPVGPVARSLGGGGHEMAAGITLPCRETAEAEAILLEKITALLP